MGVLVGVFLLVNVALVMVFYIGVQCFILGFDDFAGGVSGVILMLK